MSFSQKLLLLVAIRYHFCLERIYQHFLQKMIQHTSERSAPGISVIYYSNRNDPRTKSHRSETTRKSNDNCWLQASIRSILPQLRQKSSQLIASQIFFRCTLLLGRCLCKQWNREICKSKDLNQSVALDIPIIPPIGIMRKPRTQVAMKRTPLCQTNNQTWLSQKQPKKSTLTKNDQPKKKPRNGRSSPNPQSVWLFSAGKKDFSPPKESKAKVKGSKHPAKRYIYIY